MCLDIAIILERLQLLYDKLQEQKKTWNGLLIGNCTDSKSRRIAVGRKETAFRRAWMVKILKKCEQEGACSEYGNIGKGLGSI